MADLRPEQALTPAQRGAAALDASGLKVSEIAKALDVGAPTIRSWRKLPLYSVAVEQFEQQADADLQPLVDRIRVQVAAGVGVAVETLVDAARDGDVDAAKALLSNADLAFSRIPRRGEASAKPQAAAQAVIQVTVPESRAGSGSPLHVTESTAVEE